MIHPENADDMVDRMLMLIGDLGVGLADQASETAPIDPEGRVAHLEALRRGGRDIAGLADAGLAILRHRSLETFHSSA